MTLRTLAMILLILFHASSAWAVAMPMEDCASQMLEAAANPHAGHAEMASADGMPDCCDSADSLACQLHCAGTASCLTQAALPTSGKILVVAVVDHRLGQRLPPHAYSLLRPPQPLS